MAPLVLLSYLAVLLVLHCDGQRTICPRKCRCSNEWSSGTFGLRVDCIGASLKRVPSKLSPWTTSLILANNRISKISAKMFLGMKILRVIDLRLNRLTSIGPESFPKLPTLEELYFGNNKIAQLPFNTFFNVSKLKKIDLSRNSIKKLVYGAFNGPFQLESLHLQHNKIDVIEDGSLLGLTRLRDLYLQNNQLASIPAQLFADVYSLRNLLLYSNQIESIAAGAFFRQPSLKRLSLYDNLIEQLSQKMFAGLVNLEELYLHRNTIEKVEPWTFVPMKKLKKLYLHANLINSVHQNMFAEISLLQTLHLGANSIAYIEDGAFKDLRRLRSLYLENNAIGLLTSKTLFGLSRLGDLQIYSNKIAYVHKGAFDHLTNINRLTWDIPKPFLVGNPKLREKPSNPLYCDCNTRWLKEWLLKRSGVAITCAEPAKFRFVPLKNVTDSDLKCGPLTVFAEPRKLLIEKGADARFHCKVHPGAEITWIKNGSKLVLDEYHVAGPLGTLKIIGAALSDATDYVCIAQNEAGMSANTVSLAIGERPKIVVRPKLIEIKKPLRPAVFNCVAKGVPEPTIIWQKGDKVIGNNEIGNQLVYSGKRFHITTEGSLVIFDPRADDEDLYVCIAKNSVGSTLYRTNLYIDLSSSCKTGCGKGGQCMPTKYTCNCLPGYSKKGFSCIKDTEGSELGSGSASGSGIQSERPVDQEPGDDRSGGEDRRGSMSDLPLVKKGKHKRSALPLGWATYQLRMRREVPIVAPPAM